MRKLILILCIVIAVSNCKSAKNTKTKSAASKVVIEPKSSYDNEAAGSKDIYTSKAQPIIDYALQFEGVRYKFGGATRDGMDCSGLVFECFRAYNIILPRISRDMAKNGEKISLKNVVKGDLLFFKTANRRNDISHVGLVVSVGDSDIQFIHSTTNSGVIVSSINERYWTDTFAEARRIL